MKTKILSIAVASLVCASMAEARFFIGLDVGYTSAISETNGGVSGSGNTRFLSVKPSSWSSAFKTKTWSGTFGTPSGTTSTFTQDPYSGFNINLNFGSEHFFLDDYLGIRVGGLVGYTSYSNSTRIETSAQYGRYLIGIKETYDFLDAGINFDLMVNFWSNGSYSFGVFGGVEVDYHYLLDFNNSKTRESAKDFPSRHAFDLAGRVGVSTLMANHHRLDVLAKLPIGSVISGTETKANLISVFPTININVGYKYIF
ncbi:outer membrane beta-barrel protein [Helicobacter cholecystus]|uniref:outer membrane beta-barrel protein n=1 Tax=Helicobacter cholecystus TaxID=45498 RepID=UPI00273909C4|nr:outer membrane beta-barrel protein [Helicobacter cholecystus]